MSARLRVVEHIEVFDMDGEMVASKDDDPFSYTYQKRYYYGKKKIWEKNYSSNARKLTVGQSTLDTLVKRVDKILTRAFCFVDDENRVNVVAKGGSTINYDGKHPDVFMDKVLKLKRE